AAGAVPCSDPGLDALARAVLEEHFHLSLEDEEDLLDLVGVRGVALTWRHEHDAEREAAGGNEVRVAVLAGAAGADEPVLRTTIAVHAGVGARVPVGLPVGQARELTSDEDVERPH